MYFKGKSLYNIRCKKDTIKKEWVVENLLEWKYQKGFSYRKFTTGKKPHKTVKVTERGSGWAIWCR